MQPPGNVWLKVCSNGTGLLAKMATMPIYGKKLKRSSFPELLGWLPWNLVCSIKCPSSTKFVQMVTLDWSWPIFVKVKFGPLGFWMGKRWNVAFFQNNGNLWYESSDIMNLCECQKSRSSNDLRSLGLNVCQHFQSISPLKQLGQFQSNFVCSISGHMGVLSLFKWSWVTWPTWPSWPYMVKTLKHFLQNPWVVCLETWYVTSVHKYYQVSSNGDSRLTMTHFCLRSNLFLWAVEWGKGDTSHFSKTMVVCDMKVGTMWTFMNAKGQGHLVIQWPWLEVTRIECLSTFATTGLISIKSHMQHLGSRGSKNCSNGTGHMMKMATIIIIHVKNLKQTFLQNHWVDCFETWYVASGDWVLPILFKWWL